MPFTQPELLRYSRHLLLPEVGLEGQEKLRAGRVLLVGAGGLGSPAALYLAAAGVGTIGLVDADRVEASNLQRQVLHGTGDIGRPKVESGAARIQDINPHVTVRRHGERLTSANALEVLGGYDIVLDGSDNFPTRYLINDACVMLGLPDVYGSIHRFEGQVSVFDASRGPCYRCLFAEPPPPGLVPGCAEAGVLGVLPGIIGTLQALEAIKFLLGAGENLVGRLVLFDALKLSFRELALRKDPDCPVCGLHPTVTSLIDYEAFCGLQGVGEGADIEITVAELAALGNGRGGPQVVDVREAGEYALVHLPDTLLIPLGELPGRLDELDPDRPVVALCHHGARSRTAAELLRAAGFSDARSLRGGIDAWAREIEPGMVRY